jgi:hypothetical protein
VSFYRNTRLVNGHTVYSRSTVTSWASWPDDVRDTLRQWNRGRNLSFVYMSHIGARPDEQPSFKCDGCDRYVNPAGSTACSFYGVLTCDDCMASMARLVTPA